jgi:hypothetical protein
LEHGSRARVRAVIGYLAPAPLKFLAGRGSPCRFVRQHGRRAIGLSFLMVGYVAWCVLLFVVNTLLHLANEPVAAAWRLNDLLALLVAVPLLIWLVAWLTTVSIAATGGTGSLQLLRLGRLAWVRRVGVVGGGGLWLVLALLIALGSSAAHSARPLGGRPAPVYILYDASQAPRWVVQLVCSPTILAARQRWGPRSTIVAPLTPHSLRTALATGQLVYVAAHGTHGPLIYPGGELTPQDVADAMPVGRDLQLVYLSACHSGDMAEAWQASLAPARVITFPRFSAHVEHAWFLWVRAPDLILRSCL